jgi:hypothetical protein
LAAILAFGAVYLAGQFMSEKNPPVWFYPALFVLMAGFVLLQTFSAMVFISLTLERNKGDNESPG